MHGELVMDPNILVGVVAAINFATGILAWHTNRMARRTEDNMLKVEKATNSMKDALVAATGKAAYAAGHTAATTEGEQKAAVLAQGIAAGAAAALSPPVIPLVTP